MEFERLKSNLFNIPGWHTKQKIIVFESDDWGSIRIPSRITYDYLLEHGYPLDKSPYGKDSLESNEDLSELINVLSSYTNAKGYPAVFTINNIVANPDFEKIEEASFENYYFEPFTETYKRYPNHNRTLALIKEGIDENLLRPQLHGREHLNIKRWLTSLKKKQPEVIDLFKHSMYGLPASISRDDRRSFQRAFDYDNKYDGQDTCGILTEACNIFNNIWGYFTESFVAPNFFWDGPIERCLSENGVKYLQGQRAQFLTDYNGGYTARYHYTGQKNKFGQVYLVRNCYFEPAFDRNKDWVDSCLKEISTAFRWRKPAIISTHRVNYVGGIDIENRDHGLKELSSLLKMITKKWPEAEFISTDQLGGEITSIKT